LPIYEYRCQSCEHELEKLQRMSDGNLVDCPACEKPALKRLVSAAAFRLKGSGWYETDFKKGDKRNLAEAGKQDAAGKSSSASENNNKPEKSAGSGSEKKPAAKTASKTGKAEST